VLLCSGLVAAQGRPDLRGIWQAPAGAHRDLAALMVDPPGGPIPYREAAAEQARRNWEERASKDPLLACFQPGVPRATLLPEPFQIFYGKDRVVIVYQHVHAFRVIFTDGRQHYDEGIEFYMGDSRGRWEGDTLVVDVTNFKPETWLDASGTHHSEKLHVVERYRRVSAEVLRYEAVIEDPEVFTRPWTIRVDLARRSEPNAQLIEHECERDSSGVYRHPSEFLELYR
jgi:hypothetical protein